MGSNHRVSGANEASDRSNLDVDTTVAMKGLP
jgi:hypothetical protein